jgi:hypothetical protein
MKSYLCFFVVLFLAVAVSFAQTQSGALRGQVTDPSGAAISGATVVLTPTTGSPVTAQTNGQGMYEFKSLPAGKYSMTVVAQGFTLYENDNVVITSQPLRLNVSMTIAVETQKVQVSDTAPTVDVTPENNAGAITISGKELESLPDDPDELESDLQALAGPSAGPNGGQMYIDGFTAGQLPPKSSIREIRINQNPFSSEYDKLGYGRIEIFTKPGTDQLHGEVFADGNDSPFNSQNPFAGNIPPYYTTQFNGDIGGPIRKKASVFFDVQRRDINQVSPINAIDPTTGQQFASSIPDPRTRTNLGPRIDWAVTPNNTLTFRYQYYRDTENGNLASQFYLGTQGITTKSTEHTVQLSDTQVFGTKIVNETRFQYNRDYNAQNPFDTNPSTSVFGYFYGGGNGEGILNDTQDNYELQNYTSVIHSNHTMKFGGRFRATQATDFTTSGFNGSFLFSSFPSFQAGTPSQLNITTGSPNASINYYDFEPYFQDDWRARPNLTLSLGLRFETQNYIHDHDDWAPRLGFAWGIRGKNGTTKFVIRGGSGIFYDRFQIAQMLQATHLNGINQTEYVITNPTCYPGPGVAGLDKPLAVPISSCGTPSSIISTTYQVSPRLHAPGIVQSAISVEKQVTKSATLAVTYLNSRGFDQFITINADAPYPGTPCYPNCPTPTQNLYRYVSEANFKQNQLMVNSNARVGSRLQFAAYYSLNYANSDTSGVSSFPSNSWDISQDWGRASFDTRHRLFLMGSVGLPYLIRLSPFMIVSSGSPFNITTPYNLNGDSQYNNDRPSVVPNTGPCSTTQQLSASVYCTPYGTLDLTGASGSILPVNYGTGPNHFSINFRLTKTIGFGPSTKGESGGASGGGGGHHHGGPLFGGGGPIIMSTNSEQRYNLTFGLSVRNAFNDVNLTNPSGVVGSRLFNVSNNIAGYPYSPGTTSNRRLDLTAQFTF